MPLHSLLSSLHVFLLYYKNPCPACSIQAYIQSLQSQSVKGSLYGAYFSAFAQLFTKHGRSSSTLPQHHPLPSFLNCSKTGPPISLKFGRSIRTGSPNIPSNFQAEIRSCPRETSRKSQYRSVDWSGRLCPRRRRRERRRSVRPRRSLQGSTRIGKG